MLVIPMSFVLMQFAFDAAAQRPRLARAFPPGLPEVRLATSNADQLELSDETVAALNALVAEVQPEEERLRALTIEVHLALAKLMGTERPAKAEVAAGGSTEVPLHLRNAPTELMKELDHGVDYRYAHDEEGAYSAGENYFPEALKDAQYYHPVDRGLEKKIGEKMRYLRERDKSSTMRRYL